MDTPDTPDQPHPEVLLGSSASAPNRAQRRRQKHFLDKRVEEILSAANKSHASEWKLTAIAETHKACSTCGRLVKIVSEEVRCPAVDLRKHAAEIRANLTRGS